MSSLVVVKDRSDSQWWLACIRPGTYHGNGKVEVMFFGTDASDTWEVKLTDKEYGKTWCNPINDSTQNEHMEVGSVYTLSMPSGPAEVDRDAWPIDLGFVLGHDLTFQVREGHAAESAPLFEPSLTRGPLLCARAG